MLAGVLALCACGSLSGLDPFAAPSPPVASSAARPVAAIVPQAAAATADPADGDGAVPDGRYAGLAILTAFHGDCNAGGTGEIVVHGRAISYRDAHNPELSGLLGDRGAVDLSAGPVRLTGRFDDAVFTGRIAGGVCEYQMRFERLPG